MKVYLAARFGRQKELRVYREELRAVGIEVTSRWLDEEVQDCGRQLAANGRELAEIALDDILSAAWLIAFSEPPTSTYARGGRHVEFGFLLGTLRMANRLGNFEARRALVVGPRENIFHCLPDVVQFDKFQDCLRWLALPASLRCES